MTVPEPGPGILLIQISGIPGDVSDIELLDANKKNIGETVRGEPGSGGDIVRMRVKPGTHYLKVAPPRTDTRGREYTLYAGKPLTPPASPADVQQALVKALGWLAQKQQKDGCRHKQSLDQGRRSGARRSACGCPASSGAGHDGEHLRVCARSQREAQPAVRSGDVRPAARKSPARRSPTTPGCTGLRTWRRPPARRLRPRRASRRLARPRPSSSMGASGWTCACRSPDGIGRARGPVQP